MQSTIKKENGVLSIAVQGRLDTLTSTELKGELDEIGYNQVDIDFDFTQVEYISSAGLRLVIILQKRAMETGNQLVIRNINKVVAEVFKISGFDTVLKIV